MAAAVSPLLTMSDGRVVHPFFAKPNGAARDWSRDKTGTERLASCGVSRNPLETSDSQHQVEPEECAPPQDQEERGSTNEEHWRNRHPQEDDKSNLQFRSEEPVPCVPDSKSARKHVKNKRASDGKQASTLDAFGVKILGDSDNARVKRRRTASPDRPVKPAAEQTPVLQHATAEEIDALRKPSPQRTQQVSGSEDFLHSDPPQSIGDNAEDESLTAGGHVEQGTRTSGRTLRPRKMLSLDGKGGFGSLGDGSAEALEQQDAADTTPKTSSRPKRTVRPKTEKKAKLVVLVYRRDDGGMRTEIGQRIERLMGGLERYESERLRKPTHISATNPNRPAHPFFVSKPGDSKSTKAKARPNEASAPAPSPNLRSFTTPRKALASLRQLKATEEGEDDDEVFHTHHRQPRQGGSFEAPWPWNGFVREELDLKRPQVSIDRRRFFRPRTDKQKAQNMQVSDAVLYRLERRCAQAKQRRTQPTQPLRLPTRSVESGPSVQQNVRGLLSQDPKSHEALQRLYVRLEHSFSAFDLECSESQTWTQKYSPKRTSEILSSGVEPRLLYQWLKNLTINAVETSGTAATKQSKPSKARSKKRPRKEDLDDFIVESDEDEEDELKELTANHSVGAKVSRTVVRGGGLLEDSHGSTSKLTNAILLSGPHGCGKSAAAYAVASELGFDVFEINSASRRTAKDIFDKVGDMALNHQVRREKTGRPFAPVVKEDDDKLDEEVPEKPEPDMTKQKSLGSFFKVAPPKVVKPTPNKVKDGTPTSTSRHNPAAPAQRSLTGEKISQKQSLILFEEVDVLFEDDKTFWEGVLDLAVQSRRPIILTCSDEKLVPLQALSLHGILRFDPAPENLATDYLLLMAALEGHVLQSEAIQRLYRTKGNDLRASISELNVWCQLGVGDTKSGMSWYMQRWPRGVDKDKSGRTLRVISNGTYQHGSDRVDYGISSSALNSKPLQEQYGDILERSLDTSVIPRLSLENEFTRDNDLQLGLNPRDRLRLLKTFSRSLDALSDTDMFANALTAPEERYDVLDATQPPVPVSSKRSYTVGYTFLQGDIRTDDRHAAAELSLSAHLLIANEWQSVQNATIGSTDVFNPTDALESAPLGLAPAHLSRHDFSAAFDPISYGGNSLSSEPGLVASHFDDTFTVIVEDLAPYVRSIVAHDSMLQDRRAALDATEDGRATKRLRKTRASRSAVEGGERSSVRRERWFVDPVDYTLVMRTAGDWPRLAL